MNHSISIAGDAHPVPAQDGETILDALLRNGVGFAYSCQAGNCGACKCEYLAGEIVELEYSEQALSPAERARNVVLACRTQVRGDMHIRRLEAEEFVMHPSRVLQCRVDTLDALTHDVLRLRLTIESGGPFTFSPGQFAKLQFTFADAPRDYSMANAPHEAGLEFHVRVLPGGVSERIRGQLDIGDRVRVSGPFGASYLRQQHRGPILAVAGSTGLAPIRSIVHAALRAGMPGPIHLYFGVREERDVYGEAELQQWMRTHPNLRAHVVLSERTGGAGTRRTGLVTAAVAADLPDLTGFHAYLAGPPAMVDTAGELLRSRGLAAHDIRADAFYRAVQPMPHVAA